MTPLVRENRYSGLRHHAKVHSFRILTVVLAWLFIAASPGCRVDLSTDDTSTRLYASRGSSPITAMVWRASAHLVSCSSTSRAAAIALPTMTSGSLTRYPCSAPDCDHMLRKSCSRTACYRR